jgi:hypothetical protein
VISAEQRQLLPQRWLGLGPFINRFIAPLPGIRQLCLRTYLVGRPVRQFPDRKFSASIVIPCRNEKGNIENAILRMPRFGWAQEILFVEGIPATAHCRNASGSAMPTKTVGISRS